MVVLRHDRYSCSSLSLCMLMARVASVLWRLVGLLLVQPRRFSSILMLVGAYMLSGQHIRFTQHLCWRSYRCELCTGFRNVSHTYYPRRRLRVLIHLNRITRCPRQLSPFSRRLFEAGLLGSPVRPGWNCVEWVIGLDRYVLWTSSIQAVSLLTCKAVMSHLEFSRRSPGRVRRPRRKVSRQYCLRL